MVTQVLNRFSRRIKTKFDQQRSTGGAILRGKGRHHKGHAHGSHVPCYLYLGCLPVPALLRSRFLALARSLHCALLRCAAPACAVPTVPTYLTYLPSLSLFHPCPIPSTSILCPHTPLRAPRPLRPAIISINHLPPHLLQLLPCP